MWDVVHMDEKWFNADQDRRKVYLTPDETVEHRTTKSKRFISKVMFLAALGMWPFAVQAPATQNSCNQAA
ncbi:hypothetical protein Ae201684P_005452 [Aphanomyces euteiches]|nr:hypothetical protein Ae201684P_005452 [Aphanomyces euteiches]